MHNIEGFFLALGMRQPHCPNCVEFIYCNGADSKRFGCGFSLHFYGFCLSSASEISLLCSDFKLVLASDNLSVILVLTSIHFIGSNSETM